MAENGKKVEKKYYTLNHEKHIVVVDTTVKPKEGDKEAVALYVEMGYAMRIKSQERAAAMKNKADGLTADAIKKALENDKEAQKKFEDIVNGKETGVTNADGKTGFFAAKKWYKNYLNKKKEEVK